MNYNPYEFDRSMAAGESEALNRYTVKTFLWVMLGLLVTFGVAFVGWLTNATLWVIYMVPFAPIVVLVVTLVLSFTLAARIERMRVGTAKALFFAFSALFGFTMSSYLYLYELNSVIFVFLLTAIYFGALAAYGYVTKRDLSRIGTILRTGLIFLIVFGILSLFIPFFSAMERLVCLFGIALFLAYTAYDTQKIKAYYHHYSGYPDMLEKASIFSALQLYLDFLNLFIRLLSFLGKQRK